MNGSLLKDGFVSHQSILLEQNMGEKSSNTPELTRIILLFDQTKKTVEAAFLTKS